MACSSAKAGLRGSFAILIYNMYTDPVLRILTLFLENEQLNYHTKDGTSNFIILLQLYTSFSSCFGSTENL